MVSILGLVGQALACLERIVFALGADDGSLQSRLQVLFTWDRLEGVFAVIIAELLSGEITP